MENKTVFMGLIIASLAVSVISSTVVVADANAAKVGEGKKVGNIGNSKHKGGNIIIDITGAGILPDVSEQIHKPRMGK